MAVPNFGHACQSSKAFDTSSMACTAEVLPASMLHSRPPMRQPLSSANLSSGPRPSREANQRSNTLDAYLDVLQHRDGGVSIRRHRQLAGEEVQDRR